MPRSPVEHPPQVADIFAKIIETLVRYEKSGTWPGKHPAKDALGKHGPLNQSASYQRRVGLDPSYASAKARLEVPHQRKELIELRSMIGELGLAPQDFPPPPPHPAEWLNYMIALRAMVIPGDERSDLSDGPEVEPQSLLGPRLVPRPALCRGRENLVEQIVTTFKSRSGAVLVNGHAGMGKTTLTKQAGVHPEIIKAFGTRRWFVELEHATNLQSVFTAIVLAVGGADAKDTVGDLTTRDGLFRFLSAAPTLIILDNLETPLHADGRVASLIADLAQTTNLSIMASVRGMDPVAGVAWLDRIEVGTLPDDACRDVFMSTALLDLRSAPDADVRYLIEQCCGLALALHLVATRLAIEKDAGALRDEWDRQGTALASLPGMVDSHGRLDSLRASLAFSLRSPRLGQPGRDLYSALGALPAGMTAEALRGVLGDVGHDAASQLMLVGLLLKRDGGSISLLPPVRDAAANFNPPGKKLSQRLMAYYFGLLDQHEPQLQRAGHAAAISAVKPVLPNILALLHVEFAANLQDRPLGPLLRAFTHCTNLMNFADIESTTELLAKAAKTERLALVIRCHLALGSQAFCSLEFETAQQHYDTAYTLLDREPPADRLLEADVLLGRSRAERAFGRVSDARTACRRARQMFHEVGNTDGEISCVLELTEMGESLPATKQALKSAVELITNQIFYRGAAYIRLAQVGLLESNLVDAAKFAKLALSDAIVVGNKRWEAESRAVEADVAEKMGQLDRARDKYLAAAELFGAAKMYEQEANALTICSEMAGLTKRTELAITCLNYAISKFLWLNNQRRTADCLFALGQVYSQLDYHSTGRQFFGWALERYCSAAVEKGVQKCIEQLWWLFPSEAQRSSEQVAK